MTLEPGESGIKLKYKVKEIGAIVMYDSTARWNVGL